MNTTNPMTRYGFRIRVRSGVVVEKLLIVGRDEEDARRKLGQMYPHSVVLNAWQEGQPSVPGNPAAKATFEEIVDLINR